ARIAKATRSSERFPRHQQQRRSLRVCGEVRQAVGSPLVNYLALGPRRGNAGGVCHYIGAIKLERSADQIRSTSKSRTGEIRESRATDIHDTARLHLQRPGIGECAGVNIDKK